MLTMYKRVVFGPVRHEALRGLRDLSGREVVSLVPILLLIFWIGLYPKPFLDRIEPTVELLLARVERAGATKLFQTAAQPAVLTTRVAAR